MVHQWPSPWQPDISLVAFQSDGTFEVTWGWLDGVGWMMVVGWMVLVGWCSLDGVG